MASILRKPNSPYWFAAYRDALGLRRQRTTKTSEKPKAQRMALEWERAAESGRNGVLTETACRRVLADLHEQTNGKPLAFYTVEGWLNEWLSNRSGTAAPRTLERYTATCRDFIKAIQDRAKLSLGALTSEDLRRYRDALKNSGHSATTCNQSLKILSAPLEHARRTGLIVINPAHGVTPLKDSARLSREAFTIVEIRSLLKTMKDTDWEGCTLLGAFCGLRLRDAANLTWDAIDLDASLLTLETGKTGATISIPLHPDLLDWLKARTRGIGKAPVLPALYGKSGSGKSGLSMAFKRQMEKAGVIGKVARTGSGEGRTTSTLSFHSTRHFFVSSLSSEGVPAGVRKRLAGHSDSKTHAIYAKHELESVREAISKLPKTKASK